MRLRQELTDLGELLVDLTRLPSRIFQLLLDPAQVHRAGVQGLRFFPDLFFCRLQALRDVSGFGLFLFHLRAQFLDLSLAPGQGRQVHATLCIRDFFQHPRYLLSVCELEPRAEETLEDLPAVVFDGLLGRGQGIDLSRLSLVFHLLPSFPRAEHHLHDLLGRRDEVSLDGFHFLDLVLRLLHEGMPSLHNLRFEGVPSVGHHAEGFGVPFFLRTFGHQGLLRELGPLGEAEIHERVVSVRDHPHRPGVVCRLLLVCCLRFGPNVGPPLVNLDEEGVASAGDGTVGHGLGLLFPEPIVTDITPALYHLTQQTIVLVHELLLELHEGLLPRPRNAAVLRSVAQVLEVPFVGEE
mmetsp:Transcript_13675/g.36846  ORF Transcript_13675/g.36846 Transcript_13675/m.36846 type:complete len:352 (+) Transcript_13675:431-1486(+)